MNTVFFNEVRLLFSHIMVVAVMKITMFSFNFKHESTCKPLISKFLISNSVCTLTCKGEYRFWIIKCEQSLKFCFIYKYTIYQHETALVKLEAQVLQYYILNDTITCIFKTKTHMRLHWTRVRLHSERVKKETHLVFDIISQKIFETYKKLRYPLKA